MQYSRITMVHELLRSCKRGFVSQYVQGIWCVWCISSKLNALCTQQVLCALSTQSAYKTCLLLRKLSAQMWTTTLFSQNGFFAKKYCSHKSRKCFVVVLNCSEIRNHFTKEYHGKKDYFYWKRHSIFDVLDTLDYCTSKLHHISHIRSFCIFWWKPSFGLCLSFVLAKT